MGFGRGKLTFTVTKHGQIVILRNGNPVNVMSYYEALLFSETVKRDIDVEEAYIELLNAIEKVDSMACA